MNRCLVVDEKAVGSRPTKAGNDGKRNGDDQEKKAGTKKSEKKSEKKEIEKAKKEIEKMKDEGGDDLSFLGIGMCVCSNWFDRKKRGGRILVPATAYFLIDLGLGSFFLYQIGGGEEPNRVYNYKWDTIVFVYEHTHTLSPLFSTTTRTGSEDRRPPGKITDQHHIKNK